MADCHICVSLSEYLFDCSTFSYSYRSTLAFITVLSFLLGALCSGIAGYIGMWVSVRANVRVSSAARRSAREALLVRFSFFNCSLGLAKNELICDFDV